ncbi:hypothetical protein J2755_000381 [Methanohalophilus levihalophilus]|uniref:hypothetical protein n=1 Tax=Methanohalophilus levihalophilus TaxID=1431282 RepID=UPI001AE36F8A|nr:hypothetical protein [Methanohalophilus levihalophilus]MBP2029461.1 hypothetical protein [Methanohalophilus levihalophilus]
MRDFTLSKYNEMMEAAKSTSYSVQNVGSFLKSPSPRCLVLRHDVDRDVQRSIEMAKLENKHDVSSTYYFRHVNDVFKPESIKMISDLGHEIGFHYEVMDKAKGDPDKAIEVFKKELEDLREIADVRTVCMHGNPFAKWSNRDLWDKYDFRDYGIIGEPYLSIDYSKVLYLTDTGRTWADRNIRVKDVLDSEHLSIHGISSSDDVVDLIQSETTPQICMLVHPNRWCDGLGGWTKELLFQNVKNVGKAGIVLYRKYSSSK